MSWAWSLEESSKTVCRTFGSNQSVTLLPCKHSNWVTGLFLVQKLALAFLGVDSVQVGKWASPFLDN